MEYEYEVFDRDSGNAVAFFPSEQATREAVRTAVQQEGADAIASWLVSRVDHQGPVLQGSALVAWVPGSEVSERRPEPAKEAETAREQGAVSGAAMVTALRLWLERQASPAQQRELAPMVDTFEMLVNEVDVLSAEAEHIATIRTAQDADRARAFVATMEQHLKALTRQRLAIRDWFANQRLVLSEEEAAIDEVMRIVQRQLEPA